MILAACPSPFATGGIVRGLVASVDCNTRRIAQAGYLALTDSSSIFPIALTSLLTIYVAILGYRMLFAVGSPRLSDVPLIALKLGAILALTLNWATFQTVVFDVAATGPYQIGRLVAGATDDRNAASPIDRIQWAHDELVASAAAFGAENAPAASVSSDPASPPAEINTNSATAGEEQEAGVAERATADNLLDAASTLMMSTAGVLAIAMIAVGVLTAVGPIFIAMLLFEATRGLFAGWLRALVTATIAPMLCWIATSLLLTLLEPGLARLAAQRELGTLSIDTASGVATLIFVFAAAQAMLVVASAIVALGFNPFRSRRGPPAEVVAQRAAAMNETIQPSRAQALALAIERTSSVQDSRTASVTRMTLGGGGDRRGPTVVNMTAGSGDVRLGEGQRRPKFRTRQGATR